MVILPVHERKFDMKSVGFRGFDDLVDAGGGMAARHGS
jgi:hypothetical protein